MLRRRSLQTYGARSGPILALHRTESQTIPPTKYQKSSPPMGPLYHDEIGFQTHVPMEQSAVVVTACIEGEKGQGRADSCKYPLPWHPQLYFTNSSLR